MVDSGAGCIVLGPDDAKAANARDTHPSRAYKLSDESIIQKQEVETFKPFVEAWESHQINAAVTDRYKPLLSVSHVVSSGATVVFSPKGGLYR